MNSESRLTSKTWIPVVAGLLLILLATSPTTFGGTDGDSDLAVEGCAATGNTVVVQVSNVSDEDRAASLMVAVRVDGSLVVQRASVSLKSHSKSSVSLSFGSQVEDVLTADLIEDGNPF